MANSGPDSRASRQPGRQHPPASGRPNGCDAAGSGMEIRSLRGGLFWLGTRSPNLALEFIFGLAEFASLEELKISATIMVEVNTREQL